MPGPLPPQPLTQVPLLLLPLRLEYRVVEPAKTIRITDTTLEKKALAQTSAPAAAATPQALREQALARRRLQSQNLAKPYATAVSKPASTEIWFRWFPDDAFSEKGVAPVTDDEGARLNEFHNLIGSRKWWEVSDSVVASAWESFARAVGPQRAIHLLRNEAKPPDPSWENRIGRIASLPARVELFALTVAGLVSLGKGVEIPPNGKSERSTVSYTYEAIEGGGWLADFSSAVELGMGLKLVDKTAVSAALAADWIVAVGLYGEAAAGEIESLLRERIANGEFEILPQDAPTNNSANERSIHRDPRHDLKAFMQIAAQEESGALATAAGDTASGLLSDALGIDPAILRQAVRAADGALEDARAMLRVIGPALLDDAVDGITSIDGVDENRFIEVMSASMATRGLLPPVRSGRNGYGIATMTDLDGFTPGPDTDEDELKVLNFLSSYARTVQTYAPTLAGLVVPVLRPDDPDAAAKLETLLKASPVSVRVDVADFGVDATASIGCPYVAGAAADRRPEVYLKQLRTVAVEHLPDPTSKDTTWPLLYRIARQSLTRNTVFQVVKPVIGLTSGPVGILDRLNPADALKADSGMKAASKLSAAGFAELDAATMPKLGTETVQRIRTLNSRFAAALQRLEAIAGRTNGTAELETLMMEVLDLFQHRLDAWATGLAFQRLRQNRKKGVKSLRAGYFGMLGKLRTASATGAGDGYIQAPSMAQACSAAVLRSAYLRHRGDGAFQINLRSRRARRAMSMLDLLKKGISIGEALGMRGERWLHNRKLSRLTLPLRLSFPIQNLDPPGGGPAAASGRRVFDGLAFLEGTPQGIPAIDGEHVSALKLVLTDELDALSDLVLAEAVHQRALGAAESANAWLQVLSGEPVPANPMFLRTERNGQGSTHRLSIMAPEAAAPAAAGPRSLAEPALAAMAAAVLGDFVNLRVPVTIARAGNAAQARNASLSLKTDLRMDPLDLVIGGRSELELRIRSEVLERWLRDPLYTATLGAIDPAAPDAFVAREAKISSDFSRGAPSLNDLMAKAESLRRVAQRARALEPSDLNAAAAPQSILNESVEIELTAGAAADLRARATALKTMLSAQRSAATAAHSAFARAVALAAQAGAEPAAVSQAETARRNLVDAYKTVAAWTEPSALRLVTPAQPLDDISAVDERLTKIDDRLGRRVRALNTALASTAAAAYTTLSAARAARNTLVSAIRDSLDGEALPILPRYTRVDALRPKLDAGTSPPALLAPWAAVRGAVANAAAAAALFPRMKAYPVQESATADDAGEGQADPRAETTAPRSRYFGVLLGEEAPVSTSPTVAGLVIDEWAEQRPSEIQMAAMAINYDSPQAESPHALLLCVPPNDTHKAWTEMSAAAMVAETIAWMQMRALTTDDKLTPAAWLPRANQMAYKKVGSTVEPRIPQRKSNLVAKPWFEGEGAFVTTTDQSLPLGIAGAGVNQRSGFSKLKE